MTDETSRNPLAAQDEGSAPAPPSGPESAGGSGLTRPEKLPDEFWDDKAGVKFDALTKRLEELGAVKAERDIRAAAVPEKPDGYELGLPEDFKLPEGFKLELKADDPAVQAARDFAHKAGLTKDEFKQLVALKAQLDVQAVQAHNEAVAKEREKLGPKAEERILNVVNALAAKLGADKARALASVMATSAAQVEAMEDVVRLLSTRGVAEYRQDIRAQESRLPSNEEFAKLPIAEQLKYSERNRARV